MACCAAFLPCGERASLASVCKSGMAVRLPRVWDPPCVSRGAEVIVGALERAGVRVCFGLPGVHNLALWEALRRSAIRLIGVRHEQAAVYAADGFSRSTGRLGVAVVTTGPGAANTLGATGGAMAAGGAG